ncbi:hypothetical protein [Xylella fastidiosa]|uniref:hypothetical protein n=1 Tax=Xylella fastidiosa TaxID=2371 RepID=UPI0039853BA0
MNSAAVRLGQGVIGLDEDVTERGPLLRARPCGPGGDRRTLQGARTGTVPRCSPRLAFAGTWTLIGLAFTLLDSEVIAGRKKRLMKSVRSSFFSSR